MKALARAALLLVMSTSWIGAIGQFNTPWEIGYNGTADATDKAYAIAVDRRGNVYVTGESARSTGGIDYIVVKYDSAGNYVWERNYNNGGDDISTAIAVDKNLNVYVTGYSVNGSGDYDFATRKWDSEGTPLWTTRQNNTDTGHTDWHEYAADIVVDAAGENVYITGYSEQPGNPAPAETKEFLTVRYNSSDGEIPDDTEWPTTYIGEEEMGDDQAVALAVDPAGNVYVTGAADGAHTGDPDWATVAYHGDGSYIWTVYEEGDESTADKGDFPSDIAVDSAGLVFVTGTFERDSTIFFRRSLTFTAKGTATCGCE